MSRKRVILTNGSRLLREALQQVIDQANQLEVVQEFPDHEELPSAIERLAPEWVILSGRVSQDVQHWLDSCVADYPAVRFILLSPESKTVRLKWQTAYEEDLTNFSIKGFIDILEKDLQHI